MSDQGKIVLALITAFVAMIIALSTVEIMTAPEPDPCQTYREMRQIWEDTDGDYGWPSGAIKECENAYNM